LVYEISDTHNLPPESKIGEQLRSRQAGLYIGCNTLFQPATAKGAALEVKANLVELCVEIRAVE
jgi:hypothetical protein